MSKVIVFFVYVKKNKHIVKQYKEARLQFFTFKN